MKRFTKGLGAALLVGSFALVAQALDKVQSAYREIDVKPVAGYIGADISGIDLAGALSDAAVAEVRSALLKHKVVIGHAEQIAFTGRFGEVTYAPPHEDEPFKEFPEILPIDNLRYETRLGRRKFPEVEA